MQFQLIALLRMQLQLIYLRRFGVAKIIEKKPSTLLVKARESKKYFNIESFLRRE